MSELRKFTSVRNLAKGNVAGMITRINNIESSLSHQEELVARRAKAELEQLLHMWDDHNEAAKERHFHSKR